MSIDQQIQERLAKAMADGDMAEVMKIASEAKKAQSEADKAELKAKKGQIDELTKDVTAAVEKLIEKFGGKITELVGENHAVIQVNWIAASTEAPVVRITKSSGKKQGSGGGSPGQKFDIGTEELLNQYGGQDFKDGQTFQQAWDESNDKNHRFNIRKKLIKIHMGT